jgi:hypothetical protein
MPLPPPLRVRVRTRMPSKGQSGLLSILPSTVAGLLQGQLVEAAPRLTSLTLIKCPWLTNSAVKHLQHLRGLAALSLADNGNIRCGGDRPRPSCLYGQWLIPWH